MSNGRDDEHYKPVSIAWISFIVGFLICSGINVAKERKTL